MHLKYVAKAIKKIAITCLPIIYLTACNSPKKEEKLKDESLKDAVVVSDYESEQFLREIFLTEGLVRGTSFGNKIEDVKAREKAEFFEEKPSHVGYTVENNELETADILYFRDSSNKVIGIHIDIFLNTKESYKAMLATLKDYFKTMYGDASKDNEYVWNLSPKGGTVTVTPIDKQFDQGFEIEYKP